MYKVEYLLYILIRPQLFAVHINKANNIHYMYLSLHHS